MHAVCTAICSYGNRGICTMAKNKIKKKRTPGFESRPNLARFTRSVEMISIPFQIHAETVPIVRWAFHEGGRDV